MWGGIFPQKSVPEEILLREAPHNVTGSLSLKQILCLPARVGLKICDCTPTLPSNNLLFPSLLVVMYPNTGNKIYARYSA